MAVTSGASVPTPASRRRNRASLAALLVRAVNDPRQRGRWIGAVLCMGLFAGLFWANLGHFYHAWTTDENYSHGFLVPLISLYFANQVARRGPVPVHGGVGVGILLLLLSLAGRLVTIPVPIFFLADLSFLIGLAGLFALLFGTRGLEAVLVRVLLPDIHGSPADRTLFQDRFTAPVAGQPSGLDRDECHGGSCPV